MTSHLVSPWQPIETAPKGRIVLVCDEQGGFPFTIAKVARSRSGTFCYAGTDEEIDFAPLYWCEKDVDANPFHMPLPPTPEVSHVG